MSNEDILLSGEIIRRLREEARAPSTLREFQDQTFPALVQRSMQHRLSEVGIDLLDQARVLFSSSRTKIADQIRHLLSADKTEILWDQSTSELVPFLETAAAYSPEVEPSLETSLLIRRAIHFIQESVDFTRRNVARSLLVQESLVADPADFANSHVGLHASSESGSGYTYHQEPNYVQVPFDCSLQSPRAKSNITHELVHRDQLGQLVAEHGLDNVRRAFSTFNSRTGTIVSHEYDACCAQIISLDAHLDGWLSINCTQQIDSLNQVPLRLQTEFIVLMNLGIPQQDTYDYASKIIFAASGMNRGQRTSADL